jgi:flagellar protein FlaG
MIGKIQDLVSAAVVIGATEASPDTRSAEEAGSLSGDAQKQTKGQQTASTPAAIDETGAPSGLAASQDILQNVRETANQPADKDGGDARKKDKDAPDAKMDEQSVSYMTKELNELMSRINCNLEFQYHKEVNTMTVKMLDKKTGEVLKEVPPESMIKHMIKAKDWLGAFLDKTV